MYRNDKIETKHKMESSKSKMNSSKIKCIMFQKYESPLKTSHPSKKYYIYYLLNSNNSKICIFTTSLS